MKSTDALAVTTAALVAVLETDTRFTEIADGLTKWGVDIASATTKEQDQLLMYCFSKFVGTDSNYGT